jgi:hypothetical protein
MVVFSNSFLSNTYFGRFYRRTISVQPKNKSLTDLTQSLPKVLENLKKDAIYRKDSSNYFGVDI